MFIEEVVGTIEVVMMFHRICCSIAIVSRAMWEPIACREDDLRP